MKPYQLDGTRPLLPAFLGRRAGEGVNLEEHTIHETDGSDLRPTAKS